MATPIPLTVLGGFLGAGKTTVINHLLRACPGAVAITFHDACPCCDRTEDREHALAELARRGPTRILVECGGLADPWHIAQIALADPRYALTPLLVTADAEALPRHLTNPAIAPTLRRQLQFAEIVLITKSDRTGPAPAATAIAALRPQARRHAIAHGQIPPEALAFPSALRPARFQADTPAPPFRFAHFPAGRPLDPIRLRAALAALSPSILRLRGICRLGPDAAPHRLEYGAERWAITALDAVLDPASIGLDAIGTADMPDLAPLLAAAAA